MAGAASRHRPHFNDGVREAKAIGTLHGGNPKKRNRAKPTPTQGGALGTVIGGGRGGGGGAGNEGVTVCVPPRLPYLCGEPGSAYVLPLRYSCWLVASSLSFLLPAALAWRATDAWAGFAPLAGVYALMALLSANYWRRACNGARRDADKAFAMVTFAVTTITGAARVTDPVLLALGWPLAAAIPGLFALSIWLHDHRASLSWIAVHVAMHLAISVGMSVVVVGSS